MAKVKTNVLPIEWVEEKKGYLVGNVSPNGPSSEKIIDELLNIPLDIPALKSPDATIEVKLVFPDNFAEERVQDLATEAQKIYPDWKVNVGKKEFTITPDFSSDQ